MIEIPEDVSLYKQKIVCGLLLALFYLPSKVVAVEVVAVFPGAIIVAESAFEPAYYRLALGPQKKINNVWRAEYSESYSGKLRRLTLELPAGFTRDEVLSYYQQALSLDSAKLVYECFGRDCGSSNSWANSHFNIKQLYGLDQAQEYHAYKTGSNEWLALYWVRRGNKRQYIQLEQFVKVK